MIKERIGVLFYILFILYVLAGLLLYIFQNKLLFPADKTPLANCPMLEKSEKIDTDKFRGYFTKRSTDKIIIFYHGNGGRACDRSDMDTIFAQFGYSTLLVEYPGYAEEGRTTSMKNILKEVVSVNEFVVSHRFKKVIVVAESVGTGPAAYHAFIPNNTVDKLILITPYDNMASVASSHYPMYPMKLLLTNNFTPDEWLSTSRLPIILILAENDEVIGRKQGEKLFHKITTPGRLMYVVKNAGHNTIYGMPEFNDFLSELLAN